MYDIIKSLMLCCYCFDLQIHDIDCICGSLEYVFASVGGFATGSMFVINHQVHGLLRRVCSTTFPCSCICKCVIHDASVGVSASMRKWLIV